MRMANKRRNWDEIERRYVEGNETFDAICVAMGIPDRTFAEHACPKGKGNDEAWVLKRKRFRRKVADKSQALAIKHQSQGKEQFDEEQDARITSLMRVMGEQYKIALDQGSVDSYELTLLFKCEKLVQDIKYRALGVAPPKQAIEIAHVQAPSEESKADVMGWIAEFEATAVLSGNGEEEQVELEEVGDD